MVLFSIGSPPDPTEWAVIASNVNTTPKVISVANYVIMLLGMEKKHLKIKQKYVNRKKIGKQLCRVLCTLWCPTYSIE